MTLDSGAGDGTPGIKSYYKVSGTPFATGVLTQAHRPALLFLKHHYQFHHSTITYILFTPFTINLPIHLNTSKMQILAIFAVLTGICAPLASARCFNTGEHWGSHSDAKAKLSDACGALAGVYPPGQTKSACRDGNDFKAFNFELENTHKSSQTIDHDTCVEYISREIDNCGHGGQETINGMRVRYVNEFAGVGPLAVADPNRGDPNKGRCT